MGRTVEKVFADQMVGRLVAAGRSDVGHGYESPDGRRVVEFKLGIHGVRDLYAAVLQLAVYLGQHLQAEDATLVAQMPRLSPLRIAEEWQQIVATLKPQVANRLKLIALTQGEEVMLPHADPWLRTLATAGRLALQAATSPDTSGSSAFAWTAKGLAVWGVLTDAWLRQEPALTLGEIERRSQCSYPTVRSVLSHLEAKSELEHGRNRSEALRGFPRRSWAELLSGTDKLRETRRFADSTGRLQDPQGLARRLLRMQFPGVKLAGVAAARFYMPEFDLNGLPRVDVSVQEGATAFVRALDPALELVSADHPGVVLVVHRSRRDLGLEPHAPPSEVLLDLGEQRLDREAQEFAAAMRRSSLHG